MNIEQKREYQREWVRNKRRTNPAYAQAERVRHEDWRARHQHHVELYERIRLTRARASSNAEDVAALGTSLDALGLSDTYWDEWIAEAQQRFDEHDEATCNYCCAIKLERETRTPTEYQAVGGGRTMWDGAA